jgi:hypothetical protein
MITSVDPIFLLALAYCGSNLLALLEQCQGLSELAVPTLNSVAPSNGILLHFSNQTMLGYSEPPSSSAELQWMSAPAPRGFGGVSGLGHLNVL